MHKDTKPPTFAEFSETTTLHGLNRVGKTASHKVKRLIWLVVILAMLGIYLFIAISSILTYFSWESVTKMSKTAKPKLEFPSVSICFQNLFPRTFVEGRPEAEYWMHHLETESFWSLTEEEQTNVTHILSDYSVVESTLLFPQRLLERCTFGAEEFNCNERFKWQPSDVSSCVTYMDPEHRRRHGSPITETTGFLYGLNVWINLDVADYFITASYGYGVKILVHPADSPPRTTEHGQALAAGTEAYVAIYEQRNNNLPKPYSEVDCKEDLDSHQIKYDYVSEITTSTRYSREVCMLDCMYKYSVHSCNCSFLEEPICTLADYYSCLREGFSTYTSLCNCPYPCKYTVYDTRITELSLPTPTYINQAIKWNLTHTTPDAIRENVIQLKVFFPDLQVTEITQYQAYTTLELISNLGGQLGLFLGASIISLGELVEFLLEFCYYRANHFVKHKSPVVHIQDEKKADPNKIKE